MGKFENIAFSSHIRISPYKRYVDDFYLQTTDEGTANDFRHTMNSLQSRLKFEIEKTTKSADSLLKFYKKAVKKPSVIYMLPVTTKRKPKMNFIRNDRSYIQQRCSTQTTLENYDRAH